MNENIITSLSSARHLQILNSPVSPSFSENNLPSSSRKGSLQTIPDKLRSACPRALPPLLFSTPPGRQCRDAAGGWGGGGRGDSKDDGDGWRGNVRRPRQPGSVSEAGILDVPGRMRCKAHRGWALRKYSEPHWGYSGIYLANEHPNGIVLYGIRDLKRKNKVKTQRK